MDNDFKECKKCKTFKVRIRQRIYADSHTWKIVDEHGKMWNGRVCPKCVVDNMRERAFKDRQIKKALKAIEVKE